MLTVVAILISMLMALCLGLPFKWLWNWLMPVIFGLPKITFWQAVGLRFLLGMITSGVVTKK